MFRGRRLRPTSWCQDLPYTETIAILGDLEALKRVHNIYITRSYFLYVMFMYKRTTHSNTFILNNSNPLQVRAEAANTAPVTNLTYRIIVRHGPSLVCIPEQLLIFNTQTLNSLFDSRVCKKTAKSGCIKKNHIGICPGCNKVVDWYHGCVSCGYKREQLLKKKR